MNKRLFVLLISIAALYLCWAPPATIKWVAVGDSNTYPNDHPNETADRVGKEWKELTLDLTPYVTKTGQYEIKFRTLIRDSNVGLEFKNRQLEMYGHEMNGAIEQVDGYTFRIDRSQQTLDEFKTILKVSVRRKPVNSFGEIVIRRITY